MGQVCHWVIESSYPHKPSRESGTAMLFVLVLAVICSLLVGAVSLSSRFTVKRSGDRREDVAVINITEAANEDALSKIRSRAFSPEAGVRKNVVSVSDFGGGSYTVSCSANVALDTVYIYSTGTMGKRSKKIELIARVEPEPWEKWLKGTVTARTNVSTLGEIEIDGRDYDTIGPSEGALIIPPSGTYGISSAGTVSVGDSSTVGGNSTAPQQPALPGVTVQENMDTTGYPTTPEEVLGLPAGSLDAYKISDCPPSSVSGIVYSEAKECKTDPTGEGILILHNSSGDASLKNYHGNFKGIIIMDQVKHVNAGATVLGAVIMLGTDVLGNCFGNGGAKIHYSSKMLNKVAETCLPAPGPRTVTVLTWRELP